MRVGHASELVDEFAIVLHLLIEPSPHEIFGADRRSQNDNALGVVVGIYCGGDAEGWRVELAVFC